MSTILSIEDLSIALRTPDGDSVNVVDHIDLKIGEGQAVGVVGESGSGKSLTALATMRLLPRAARLNGGRIVFNGVDLAAKSDREMEAIRGTDISLVFQSSKTALNPLMKVGDQIARVYRQRFGMGRKQAWSRATELLNDVGIAQADRRAHAFPHQFSGGMAQRVMIALAIACQPKLLIADEPTTGLDVTTEAQILDLLQSLQRANGSSLMLITHNLGVVSAYCDAVAVMHAGHVVEYGPLREIFHHPAHPYTQGLLASIPRPDRPEMAESGLVGRAPELAALPRQGCRFIARCPRRMPICDQPLTVAQIAPGHVTRCHLYDGAANASQSG